MLAVALVDTRYSQLSFVAAFAAVAVVILSFKLTRRFFIFVHDDDSITYSISKSIMIY